MQRQLHLWEEPHVMEDTSRSPLIPLRTHEKSKATLGKDNSSAGAALPSGQCPLPWDFKMLATWK